MLKNTRIFVLFFLAVVGFLDEIRCPNVPSSRLSRASTKLTLNDLQRTLANQKFRQEPANQLKTAVASLLGPVGMIPVAEGWITYNRNEGAYVNSEMSVRELVRIQTQMYTVAANDRCAGNPGISGTKACVSVFKEFRKIPNQYRGDCANAYLADCHDWGIPDLSTSCAFYVKSYPGEDAMLVGRWWTLQDCADGFPFDQLKAAHRAKKEDLQTALSRISSDLELD